MNSTMSPLEALNESTFQHFFLRLPNPSFSTKTTAGTVHSFFSDGSPASSAPSSNYPSPYSLSPATYGNWTNSSNSSISSLPTSVHSSPSFVHPAHLNPYSKPFVPNGYASSNHQSHAGPGPQNPQRSLFQDPLFLSTDTSGQIYPWLPMIKQVSRIRDRRTSHNDSLIQSLARSLVACRPSIHHTHSTWTDADLYPLVEQLFWAGCQEQRINCERDTLAYFSAQVVYAFVQRAGMVDAPVKFSFVMEKYALKLFTGCWDTEQSQWSLQHPRLIHQTQIPFKTQQIYIHTSVNLCSFVGYLYQMSILSPSFFSTSLYKLTSQLTTYEHLIAVRELLVSARAKFPEYHVGEWKKELEKKVKELKTKERNGVNCSLREVGVPVDGMAKQVLRAFEDGLVPPHLDRHIQVKA